MIPVALLLSGCGVLTPVSTIRPAARLTVAPEPVSPAAPASSGSPLTTPSISTATAAVEPTPTPEASVSPCEGPSAIPIYYCVTKNGEGGHGGSPVLDLPASIAMDYWVDGTCTFSLGLSAETSTAKLPSLTRTVRGTPVDGTWRVTIRPGRYAPLIGEAVGCVYSVKIRDDRHE